MDEAIKILKDEVEEIKDTFSFKDNKEALFFIIANELKGITNNLYNLDVALQELAGKS